MKSKKNNQKRDIFAEIATGIKSLREEGLIEPVPPELPEVYLPRMRKDTRVAFSPKSKIDTMAKLRLELKRHRRRHARFMQNLAPQMKNTRIELPLKRFDWRVQSKRDQKDFSRVLLGKGKWEEIDIPHYGDPLGRAVTYYRTTFNITELMLAKGALFICFKGVDYKAHIFLNSSYLGSHEGFFAPFEFDFTDVACLGQNTLLVKVENDAICMGNDSWEKNGSKYEGDKLYAATGPGYDEPEVGWHHCPPGMGIYHDVFIEARTPIQIHDIFVRPLLEESRAEAWIEINSCYLTQKNISLELSVFGQNFRKTVFHGRKCDVEYAGPGVNFYRLPFDVPDPKIWSPGAPWLYQIQVQVGDKESNKTLDTAVRQFGMRSFRMEADKEPKGRFYLNGREIRLRGANTMGHLQQCVIKKDWGQLRDDILLAKICHMNFLRMTQRPVQSEIYDYCDKLGMMTQTDLPLFSVLRRNQFSEALKQAGEMERLVRSHPCNIMITYINEPSPNAGNKPHRHLTRKELEDFFVAADRVVRLINPDRVIKAVDGDYDPPGPGLPDNHCYCGWYNGHGLDLGKLHKGYWQKVKPGWLYACGEFGAEGLDFVEVMHKYYPEKWLPQNKKEEKSWTPGRITQAQTGRFHYMWFDTQNTLKDWVRASQMHQAWVTRLMTEAFRRDNRMNSFAIHLFIDAFPSGWMKAIMDVDRQPKPAYFAYRDAITPLAVNLRTDRLTFFAGEEMCLEAWICNDLNIIPNDAFLHYQLEMGEKVVFARRTRAVIPVCSSQFQGLLRLWAPAVKRRSQVTIRLGLVEKKGKILHEAAVCLDIFPAPGKIQPKRAVIIGSRQGKAAQLAGVLGLDTIFSAIIKPSDVILIDSFVEFDKSRKAVTLAVQQGATAVFIELAEGEFEIDGDKITVVPCGMGERHFVSCRTGHSLVAGFDPNDFKFCYNPDKGYVTPILAKVFTVPNWEPILVSGNGDWKGDWHPCLAAAEKKCGNGYFRICMTELIDRTYSNPAALVFVRRFLGLANSGTGAITAPIYKAQSREDQGELDRN